MRYSWEIFSESLIRQFGATEEKALKSLSVDNLSATVTNESGDATSKYTSHDMKGTLLNCQISSVIEELVGESKDSIYSNVESLVNRAVSSEKLHDYGFIVDPGGLLNLSNVYSSMDFWSDNFKSMLNEVDEEPVEMLSSVASVRVNLDYVWSGGVIDDMHMSPNSLNFMKINCNADHGCVNCLAFDEVRFSLYPVEPGGPRNISSSNKVIKARSCDNDVLDAVATGAVFVHLLFTNYVVNGSDVNEKSAGIVHFWGNDAVYYSVICFYLILFDPGGLKCSFRGGLINSFELEMDLYWIDENSGSIKKFLVLSQIFDANCLFFKSNVCSTDGIFENSNYKHMVTRKQWTTNSKGHDTFVELILLADKLLSGYHFSFTGKISCLLINASDTKVIMSLKRDIGKLWIVAFYWLCFILENKVFPEEMEVANSSARVVLGVIEQIIAGYKGIFYFWGYKFWQWQGGMVLDYVAKWFQYEVVHIYLEIRNLFLLVILHPRYIIFGQGFSDDIKVKVKIFGSLLKGSNDVCRVVHCLHFVLAYLASKRKYGKRRLRGWLHAFIHSMGKWKFKKYIEVWFWKLAILAGWKILRAEHLTGWLLLIIPVDIKLIKLNGHKGVLPQLFRECRTAKNGIISSNSRLKLVEYGLLRKDVSYSDYGKFLHQLVFKFLEPEGCMHNFSLIQSGKVSYELMKHFDTKLFLDGVFVWNFNSQTMVENACLDKGYFRVLEKQDKFFKILHSLFLIAEPIGVVDSRVETSFGDQEECVRNDSLYSYIFRRVRSNIWTFDFNCFMAALHAKSRESLFENGQELRSRMHKGNMVQSLCVGVSTPYELLSWSYYLVKNNSSSAIRERELLRSCLHSLCCDDIMLKFQMLLIIKTQWKTVHQSWDKVVTIFRGGTWSR